MYWFVIAVLVLVLVLVIHDHMDKKKRVRLQQRREYRIRFKTWLDPKNYEYLPTRKLRHLPTGEIVCMRSATIQDPSQYLYWGPENFDYILNGAELAYVSNQIFHIYLKLSEPQEDISAKEHLRKKYLIDT